MLVRSYVFFLFEAIKVPNDLNFAKFTFCLCFTLSPNDFDQNSCMVDKF